MGLFDFGEKQRMHTQVTARTSGNEMFKIEEYQSRKRTTIYISIFNIMMFAIAYFFIKSISNKMMIFLVIIQLGSIVWGYYNYKSQRRLMEQLYS